MLSGQPAPKLTRHEHPRLNMRAAAASREIAIGPRSEGPDVAAAQPHLNPALSCGSPNFNCRV
jgi:hypothetical protein